MAPVLMVPHRTQPECVTLKASLTTIDKVAGVAQASALSTFR